jgi:PAS domain S-box-containing protein
MIQNYRTPALNNSGELVGLIDLLLHTDQRLEEMTAGEVDAVLDAEGRSYVLIGAQERMRKRCAGASEKTKFRDPMLSVALSSMSDFAQIYDLEGRICFANRALLSLWGLSLETVEGKNFFDLGYPVDLAEKLQRQLKTVIETGQKVVDETAFTGATGTEGYYEYIFSPVEGVGGAVEFVVGTTRDITERKLSEDALHRQRIELRVLFDLIPAMLCIKDTENRFVQVNRRLAEASGRTVEEIEGKSAEDLYPLEAAKYFADDLEVIRSGEPKLEILEVLRTQEGVERWVQTDKVPIRLKDGRTVGLVVMTQDVTARKQAESALSESEERLRLALDAAQIGMFDWDLESDMVVTSPGHDELWDYASNGFETNVATFLDRVHPEDSSALGREIQRCKDADERFDHEFRIVWPDRTIHWLSAQGKFSYDTVGRPLKLRGLTQDITRRKSAETALRLMNEELEERVSKRTSDLEGAKEEADRANNAKSEFLSRMSHELRTPLNAVLGYAQLLDLRFDDPKITESTRSILKSGQHLLQLINEVMDLSRIESGLFAISIEPVLVAEALVDAVALVQPLADRANVRLKIERESCADLYLLADRQRLVQVFVNLLGNAIKYNKPFGRVSVLCKGQLESTGRIEISDSGFGIAPEDQELLFEPFRRFGDHLVEGTGLGLALSQRFIRLMGGTLGLAESSPAGSTFFIELDACPSPNDKVNAVSKGDSLAGPLRSLRGTVLYIEDNPANLRLLELVFAESPNITLLTASQGSLGCEMAVQSRPDLILLDLHLPDQMGDQILNRLKADVHTWSIPVVMVSADVTPKQMRALREAGAVDYLTKPIDLRRLFAVLGEFLPKAE